MEYAVSRAGEGRWPPNSSWMRAVIAKTYLKRVKAKYLEAGLPVYTKLDLAERVRADCSSGTGRRAARGVRS